MENNIHLQLLNNCKFINIELKNLLQTEGENFSIDKIDGLLKERERIIKEIVKIKKPDNSDTGNAILQLEKSNIDLFGELISKKTVELNNITLLLKGLNKYKTSLSSGSFIDLSE